MSTQRHAPNWLTNTVIHDGFPVSLRVRPDINTPDRIAQYPKLVCVTHTLKYVETNGLPEPDYNDTLIDFDASLIEVLEFEANGAVVIVETFGGRRNYYAYVSKEVDAEKSLRGVEIRFPIHQITSQYFDDDQWTFYSGYREKYQW